MFITETSHPVSNMLTLSTKMFFRFIAFDLLFVFQLSSPSNIKICYVHICVFICFCLTTILAFSLADEGYDVWIGNFRGTRYSSNHTTLDKAHMKYWDFSFHEMGIYDVPAMLSYIYSIRNQKVIYVGFSMASTTAFIYSSMFPEEAQKMMKVIVAMAPIAFLRDVPTNVKYLASAWEFLEVSSFGTIK